MIRRGRAALLRQIKAWPRKPPPIPRSAVRLIQVNRGRGAAPTLASNNL